MDLYAAMPPVTPSTIRRPCHGRRGASAAPLMTVLHPPAATLCQLKFYFLSNKRLERARRELLLDAGRHSFARQCIELASVTRRHEQPEILAARAVGDFHGSKNAHQEP